MINYLQPQKNWQMQLSDTINTLDELLTILNLSELAITSYQPKYKKDQFPLRVPRSFVAKMKVGDPLDPLLLQVLPDIQELQQVSGYVADPLAFIVAIVFVSILITNLIHQNKNISNK